LGHGPTTNRFASLLLFSTIALAPLPFGSTDPAMISVWCVVLGLALVVVHPVSLRRAHFLLLGLAGSVVAGYAIVLHEQLSVHAWFRLSSPSPLWLESSRLLQTSLPSVVTMVQDQPILALGAPLSSMLSLVCAFLICIQRDRARQLISVVAWSGAAYAVFGIASYIMDPTKLLWRTKQAYATVLTATFVNRNTTAVYFGACALIWQLLILEAIEKRLPPASASSGLTATQLLRRVAFTASRKMLVAVSMFVLCLAAMFLTGSRAGVVGSLAIMVAAPAVFFRRRLSRTGRLAWVLASGAGLALGILETLGSGVSSRFDLDRLADGGRLETYRSTIHIIADHPWLGTGLGTFPWVFPAYRSGSISTWGVWDRAHDSLLELASEVGVPLALLVTSAWIVALLVLIKGVRERRRDLILPIAGCLVAILALLHSGIDFSLQIPGFAITVAGIVGCGLAQSFRRAVPAASDRAADPVTNDINN